MNASIVTFPLDLEKVVSEAVSLRPGMTVDDLMMRHRRLAHVFAELWTKEDCSPAELRLLERASLSGDAFHSLARRAGVSKDAIDAFNERREDRKAWREWRESLPPSRRL